MKRALRMSIALLLTLTMIFEYVPVSAFADFGSPKPEEEKTVQDPSVLYEADTLREPTVKHFAMSDGTYTAVQYPFPVHYEADGWQDYDNTPKATENGYVIENGDESRSFSTDGAADLLYSAASGKTAVSFTLMPPEGQELNYAVTVPEREKQAGPQAGFFPEKLTSQICYNDILPGVSLTYTMYGPSLKEDITLERIPDTAELTFQLKLEGLSVKPLEDGSVLLTDESGSAVWQMEAPYMYDAAGEFSDAAEYKLIQEDDHWLLTVAADREWLAKEERVYPVVIDPSLTRNTTGTGSSQPITTTFLKQGLPDATGYVQIQFWGWGVATENQQLTGIARVNNLPTIPEGGVMNAAAISYYFDSFSGAGMSSAKLGVREISSGLPASASSWYSYITNLTWNTKPTIENEFLDTVVVSNATVGRVVWDITRVVKKWYEEPGSNCGLAFDITNPQDCSTSVGACGRFYGYANTWYPIFAVDYRDTVGVEEYYTSQVLPADRAGTAYLGDYTGQLTLIRTDAALASTVMPGSVSHVYNSAFSNTDQPRAMEGTGMHLGRGWSLDAVQTVKTTGGVLTYTDGDGTRHAFTRSGSSGPYYDEDGLGLQLAKTSSSPETYELTNDRGDKLTFVRGLLFEKTDVYGNKLQYRYNTCGFVNDALHIGESRKDLSRRRPVKGTHRKTVVFSLPNGELLLEIFKGIKLM